MLAAAALLLTMVSGLRAHAAERVYLRSGSDLVCDHARNVDGRVRLYLTQSEESYLDLAASDILRTETVAEASEPQAAPGTGKLPASAAPSPAAQPNMSEILEQAGSRTHLDPDLLASVVRAESGGRVHAVSRSGARGLMQLMPGTAADLGVRDSFAPEENVAGGSSYLDALLMYYHEDVALALAAYNAGPAAVARYHGIPPYAETRRYVARVIHEYNRRKRSEMLLASRSQQTAPAAVRQP